MASLSNMPFAGIVVIIIIGILFVLSLIVLFAVYSRYRFLTRDISGTTEQKNRFMRYTVSQFAESYKRYGKETNTPAIIEEAVGSRLSGCLLAERFLNNAVSLFVTLGLFGTFLGLSLSVGSLSELLSYGNSSDWMSVLDSVGGGLMSALSGMGVAFYTSLVGVTCSILLTVLRSIFSPSAARELMESKLELWLDQSVAPTLPTKASDNDIDLIHEMIDAMNDASYAMEKTLDDTVSSLRTTLKGFDSTVSSFNGGVHDFSEFNYNLRGTVERLDLGVREFSSALKNASARIERGDN